VKDSTLRHRYFAVLLALQALTYGWLLLSQRIPRGHDTLSVLLLQYSFLAQPGSGAGVALWVPQLAHGMTSTWFANVQAGLLQNALLLFHGVPEGTPMLPIFYAGLFLEDLLLLVGVWRLGARFYRTPSAQFFVAAAAVGSSMWVSNIFWSHRLITGVPLLISLTLDFLETGSRTRLLLAASLGSLLLLGSAVYIPVASGLSVALFLTLHIGFHRRKFRATLPTLRPRRADALWIAAVVVLVAASMTAVLADLGSIRQYQRGRNPDGSVTLDAFLTYPGGFNPLRYLDLALGLNVSTDFSLYAGLCPLLMAFHAFTRRPRKEVLVLSLTLLLILLFSSGYLSGVGMIAYEGLPPMRYFRYVALTGGLVKLFLILLSGFGFDAMARDAGKSAAADGRRMPRIAMAAAGLLAAQMVYRLARPGSGGDGFSGFLVKTMGDLVERLPRGNSGTGLSLLALAAAPALLVAVRKARGQSFALLVPLMLILHGIDLGGWKFRILREATLPLSPPLLAAFDLDRLPYALRRTPSDEGNSRAAGFGREILNPRLSSAGMLYDYADVFLHRDASWSSYFVTQWSPSIDLLLRARAGRPLTFDRDPPPTFLSGDPPRTAPEGFARLIGERGEKIQLYSTAHAARSDEEIAAILERGDFRGETLYLSPEPGEPAKALDPSLASLNERLDAAARVLEFGPDRVRIEVDVPPGHADDWLYYADCWHPGWRASVDGAPRPVRRANLAYKAVPLHAGRNVVEFRFHAPLRAACYALLGFQCLGWTLGLLACMIHFLGIPLPHLPARSS